MVLQYLLKNHNEPIDIITIMTRGHTYAEHTYNSILKLDENREFRLIKFYPVGRFGGIMDEEKYEKAIRSGDIPSNISFEEFFKNPKIRFKNDLKVRNVALLIDDLIYNGDTIRNTIKEMLMLGYSKNNLYILLEEITSYPFGGLCIPNWNNLNQRNPLGDIVCQPTHKNWYYQK